MPYNKKMKRQAEGYRPGREQPLRKRPRTEGTPTNVLQPFRPEGDPVWHGVYGPNFDFPLPPESKGPIRAREIRKRKGIDGY